MISTPRRPREAPGEPDEVASELRGIPSFRRRALFLDMASIHGCSSDAEFGLAERRPAPSEPYGRPALLSTLEAIPKCRDENLYWKQANGLAHARLHLATYRAYCCTGVYTCTRTTLYTAVHLYGPIFRLWVFFLDPNGPQISPNPFWRRVQKKNQHSGGVFLDPCRQNFFFGFFSGPPCIWYDCLAHSYLV